MGETVGMSVKQRQSVKHSTRRVNIFDGSVRAGKTFGWLWIILNECATYTGAGSVVIFGKNRDSIFRNVFEPIENVDVFAPFRPYVRYRQGSGTAHILGRRVHVIGANDEGSESRIRGMTIGRAFGDEITVLNKSFFKQMLARMSVDGAKLWGTTNPDSPAHWLKADYLNKIPGSVHYDDATPEGDQLTTWTYWHFTMDDNPSLSDEYRDALRREYTGLWYKRFILGLWVSAEGAIYPMWDEDKHTIRPESIPQISRTLALGVDYGTTHPTAGMLLGVGTDHEGITRLYVLDEWAPATGTTDAKLSADLTRKRDEWRKKWPEPEWTYVDPAAKSFYTQLWEDNHPDLAKADNAVLDGIRTVASLLDNGDLLVSKTCTNLIRELPGYRWDDKKAQRGVEAPVKEQDDHVDALRYSVYSSRWEWARLLNRELEHP
ncbi:PBSX family phage terminase large subunit [Corynebacterium liangguodongii]|uniref:PBSX family phage terminase large subunit n=1 Tax=Corynebacterium liangguodongii TaxID=2079535 RepID=A0A2S0WGD3_9CORY|nr:PBSX family phage terminase large subunit [Corynebacterium liangguodongii]AWB84786.1 PBSX family phage terminase large subunit [Corynebacterium liangguodongii]PWB99144.1 PBSX family phage terminase large subunit [Corynebacterium liangguodongii]